MTVEPPAEGRSRGAVFITGASSGIGKACAIQLAARGWQVLAGIRNLADGEMLVAESGGGITPVQLDLARQEAIKAAAEKISAQLDGRGLRGLVNNAGMVVPGPCICLPIEEIRRQFEVNLFGQIALIQALVDELRKTSGTIVNISSINGVVAKPFLGAYSASKFALEGFSDALRMELRDQDVRVAVVQPGSIATPIWSKSAATLQKLRADNPSPAWDYYDAQIETLLRATDDLPRTAPPPSLVVDAVEHALTSARPKTRYRIGSSARTQAWLRRILSDRRLDRIILKKLQSS